MLQLRLEEPYNQVFVGISLENPLTGESTIVDAKIDTGAVVTTIPMEYVSDLGLEVIGTHTLAMADGTPLQAYVCLCNVSLSDEDTLEMPIYVVNSSTGIALIGMDILQQCDYAQWHEIENGKVVLRFKLEIFDETIDNDCNC